MLTSSSTFVCRLCGQAHTPVALGRTQRAVCIRCGMTLARPAALSPHAGTALALAGLLLFAPAAVLPFARASRIGPPQTVTLLDGPRALWEYGMPSLAGWVALCGIVVPALLLGTLAGACWVKRTRRQGSAARWVMALARALEAWSMPDVHVLAVLIAFIRIELLADVSLGPGFWCYVASALAIVLAWRVFELDAPPLDTSSA